MRFAVRELVQGLGWNEVYSGCTPALSVHLSLQCSFCILLILFVDSFTQTALNCRSPGGIARQVCRQRFRPSGPRFSLGITNDVFEQTVHSVLAEC